MAMLKAAKDIVGEAKGAQTADAHHKRQDLAIKVINDSPTWAPIFAKACAAGSALDGGYGDVNLDTAVSSAWNDIAGVKSYS